MATDSLTYYEAYGEYATAYDLLGQLDSGMRVKKQVLAFLDRQPYNEKKQKLLSSTYNISLHSGKLDSCSLYMDKAGKYFRTINYETALYYVNAIRIGLAIKRHQYDLASRLQRELTSNEGIEPNIISIRNKYLEDLSLKQADYQSAYYYLKENIKLNDSIRNELTQKRITELDMRYKQDATLLEKEILIQRQEAQVESLKQGKYIWILLCFSLILGSIHVYFFTERKHNQQRMGYLEQVAKSRISNIRNRISPHFMLNVLNKEMNVEELKPTGTKTEIFIPFNYKFDF